MVLLSSPLFSSVLIFSCLLSMAHYPIDKSDNLVLTVVGEGAEVLCWEGRRTTGEQT